ncbi:phage terminase small subunit P27 family [Enterococcus gallinarum]|uniref:phage terminase small subunit P27 family n=1 Tax=Enterococcus gallinarum TaxID=1353 RepID=UPI0040400F9F
MGRKLTLLDNNKKHLTKDEVEDRKSAEKLAGDGLVEMQITAPNHMNSIAKQEYKRVVGDLQKLPLRNLDRAMLENYCLWYSVFKETSQKLTEQGNILDDGEGNYEENPLIKTLEKATKNIKSTASELGLTVDSRLRLYLPKKEKKKETMFDKFG